MGGAGQRQQVGRQVEPGPDHRRAPGSACCRTAAAPARRRRRPTRPRSRRGRERRRSRSGAPRRTRSGRSRRRREQACARGYRPADGRMTGCRLPPSPSTAPRPGSSTTSSCWSAAALAPLTGFNEPGSPVTLTLPGRHRRRPERRAGRPRGPAARPGRPPTAASQPLTHAQYGPFRRLHLTPAQVREQYAGRTFVPVTDAARPRASSPRLAGRAPVVLLALVGARHARAARPVGLLRATLAAAGAPAATPRSSPSRSPSHGDAEADHALGVQVVAQLRRPRPGPRAGRRRRTATCPTTIADDRRRRPARRRTSRAWCCSSPASPAAASPRSPGPLHGPDPRAGRAARSPASTATSYAATSRPG